MEFLEFHSLERDRIFVTSFTLPQSLGKSRRIRLGNQLSLIREDFIQCHGGQGGAGTVGISNSAECQKIGTHSPSARIMGGVPLGLWPGAGGWVRVHMTPWWRVCVLEVALLRDWNHPWKEGLCLLSSALYPCNGQQEPSTQEALSSHGMDG